MATLTHTFTRTFVARVPANPYLACDLCGARVEYWHDDETAADEPLLNYPCEHDAGYHDTCPSWGPVDGCTCPKGHRAHGDPQPPRIDHGKDQGPL